MNATMLVKLPWSIWVKFVNTSEDATQQSRRVHNFGVHCVLDDPTILIHLLATTVHSRHSAVIFLPILCVVVCECDSDWSFIIVIVVLCALSYHIKSRYIYGSRYLICIYWLAFLPCSIMLSFFNIEVHVMKVSNHSAFSPDLIQHMICRQTCQWFCSYSSHEQEPWTFPLSIGT